MSAAYVAIGQTKGQTLLPLPATSEESDQKLAGSTAAVPGINKNKDALHLLENAVVTWTRQIKGALKATPQSAAAVCSLPELGNCWLVFLACCSLPVLWSPWELFSRLQKKCQGLAFFHRKPLSNVITTLSLPETNGLHKMMPGAPLI